ncbi:unnamed protein product [Discosporangium mesarthrocarpum]
MRPPTRFACFLGAMLFLLHIVSFLKQLVVYPVKSGLQFFRLHVCCAPVLWISLKYFMLLISLKHFVLFSAFKHGLLWLRLKHGLGPLFLSSFVCYPEAEEALALAKRKGKGEGSRRLYPGRWGRQSRVTARKSIVQLSAYVLRDRNDFHSKLLEFWSGLGEPKGHLRPLCGNIPIDLHQLYQCVTARGGFYALKDLDDWAAAARQLQLPMELSDRAWKLRELYARHLSNFEVLWAQQYQRERERLLARNSFAS